jgi:hypothetical protein
MECQKCLNENKRSISEKGYGYGYIGNSLCCMRHNNNTNMTTNNTQSYKWTNNQHHDRSKRIANGYK